jgi:outer membrane protein assembly factor BamB
VFLTTAVSEGELEAPKKGLYFGGDRPEPPKQRQRWMALCLDRDSGKTLWSTELHGAIPTTPIHLKNSYASETPVTDGKHLIVSFGSFGLYGYDLKGKRLWEKDLGDMRTRNSFGEGSSPALDGNTVVVLWDHEGDDFIVALDKRTGRELWRQQRDEPTGWCTPLIVSHGGRKQVIVNGTHKVRSYDLKDGTLLWECAGQTVNVTFDNGANKIFKL